MEDKTNDALEQLEISSELQKTIEETVAKIKAEKTDVKAVFPIVVEGAEWDEKELYVGYFRQPTFKTFSKYLTASQKDQAVAMRTLAKECFLEGDKELVDDDSLFLFGLMGQLAQVIEMRNGKLVNLSKTGK